MVYELRKQTAAIAVNSPLLDVSTPHRYSTTYKAITLHGGQRSSQNNVWFGFLSFFLFDSFFWESETTESWKFSILPLKPRSNVKILIYRTLAISYCIRQQFLKVTVKGQRRYSTTYKAITLHGGQRSSQNKFLLCIVLAFRTKTKKRKRKGQFTPNGYQTLMNRFRLKSRIEFHMRGLRR